MNESHETSVKTNKRGRRVFALLLALCLAAGALGITAFAEETEKKNEPAVLYESGRDAGSVEVRKAEPGTLMTVPEVYANCVESTVGIQTKSTVNYYGYQTSAATAGSGFIVSENGYIVTNYHIVDSADKVTVSDYAGATYEAKIIGYDESNDVAVLKIEAENLKPVVLGSSGALNVGDAVAAIGNPLGELTFTLTTGIISAKDREITVTSGNRMILLQTDCAINAGNSGGALFNMYGEVIGITNAKYSSSGSSEASIENIGFAVPMDQVRPIIESIIENGYYSKPYIGITVGDVSDEMKDMGIPAGAKVASVVEGAPADKAGLKANDIITSVNGEAINGYTKLTKIVSRTPIGDTLHLSVYRKGETLDIDVVVEEYKTEEPEKAENAAETEQPSNGNNSQGNQGNQGNGYYSNPYGYGYGYGNGGSGSIFDYFFGGGNGYGNGSRWY